MQSDLPPDLPSGMFPDNRSEASEPAPRAVSSADPACGEPCAPPPGSGPGASFPPLEPLSARPQFPEDQCIILIGMAAAGKSTMGRELSRLLGWVFVDSDNLIEAAYGARLQTVADALSKDGFLDVEETVIKRIRMQRCVIATGGSVVYRPEAVEHLRGLGPLLYVDVPLDIVLERIARKPDRGLAIAPGQTVEDLFNERRVLYERAADLRVQGGDAPALEYSLKALDLLREYWEKK